MSLLITFEKIIETPFMISASFGILGGVMRALIEFMRISLTKKKSTHIQSRGVAFYFFALTIIGAFAGVVLDYGWALSALGGYSAQDFLDLVFKSMDKVKVNINKK